MYMSCNLGMIQVVDELKEAIEQRNNVVRSGSLVGALQAVLARGALAHVRRNWISSFRVAQAEAKKAEEARLVCAL